MARQSLDSLLGNTAVEDTPVVQPAAPVPPATLDSAPQSNQQSRADKGTKPKPAPRDPIEVPLPNAGEAKYLTLIRKEARLREEQYANLTDKSRQLNRAKKGGERITENTLIRVAIDLLWAQAENLRGVDEAELRKSVGL